MDGYSQREQDVLHIEGDAIARNFGPETEGWDTEDIHIDDKGNYFTGEEMRAMQEASEQHNNDYGVVAG